MPLQHLPTDHECRIGFLDETGVVATDVVFAVGCLVVTDQLPFLRALSRLRGQTKFRHEWHFKEIDDRSASAYCKLVDVVLAASWTFHLVLADRNHHDVVESAKTSWRAYEVLSEHLLKSCLGDSACMLTVLADEYTTPADITFEDTVRANVNTDLGRLAVPAIVRVTSHATELMQVADLLTSIAAFPTRTQHGTANFRSTKGSIAKRFLNRGGRERLHVVRYDGPPAPA